MLLLVLGYSVVPVLVFKPELSPDIPATNSKTADSPEDDDDDDDAAESMLLKDQLLMSS